MIIYIDESGDLGLKNGKGPKFFIFTALILKNENSKKHIKHAISKTLHHKIAKGTHELKGHNSSLKIKKYFYKQFNKNNKDWSLITTITNKKPTNHNPATFYAEALLSTIDLISIDPQEDLILITIDKNLSKRKEVKLAEDLKNEIKKKFKNRLTINFENSCTNPGLQAVDQFCSGIGRKYNQNDLEWYSIFSEKILIELIRKPKK